MANPQPDPSMDEILASIRAIISEDDAEANTPAAQQTAPVPKDIPFKDVSALGEPQNIVTTPAPKPITVQAQERQASPVAQLQETAAQAMAVQQEGVQPALPSAAGDRQVDTTTSTQEDAPQVPNTPIESMDEAAVFEPEKTAMAKAAAVAAAAAIQETPARPTVEAHPTDVPSTANAPEKTEQNIAEPHVPVAEKPVHTQESAAPDSSVREDAGLMDDTTYASAANVLGSLSQNIQPSLNQQSPTLEDVVCKALEPLLKQWLDENLLPIVEDKVEEEVRRLARRR